MLRVAVFSFRRRRLVLAAWIVALIGTAVALVTVGAGYDDDFELPNTESARAIDLLVERAPGSAGDEFTIVAAVDQGTITDAEPRAALTEVLDELTGNELVASVASPYAPGGERQVSPDGRIAFATVTLDGYVPNDIEPGEVLDLVEETTIERTDGLQVEATGSTIQSEPEQGTAELIGLVAAAIVLFVVFGSLVAMSLPILTAVLCLGVSISLIGLLSNAIGVATFAPILAILLGLGVGIDYALFMVTRARQELLAGATPEQALRTAANTSGRAVLFAGITVCIALLGMFALGFSFLYGVAIACSLSVAMTVVASLTLLPALLGFAGVKILPKKQRALTPAQIAASGGLDEESAGWKRWSAFLDRRPAAITALALLVMLVLCAPALSLRLGIADQGSDPSESTTRQGYDLLAEGFGPGFNGPLQLVTDVGEDASTTATDRVREALDGAADVAQVTPTIWIGPDGPGAEPVAGGIGLTTVYPATAPQEQETSELVDRLRDEVIPAAVQGTGNEVLVAGGTAIFEDFSTIIAEKLPLFVGIVVALSFLLLTAVFRSVVVATVAAIMNILSIVAAFGVVVAVFQWGWGLELLGVDRTGPILSFLPVILFAILFGLSMDYEVFLLSRIHEEWVKRPGRTAEDNRQAVLHGLAATGQTITAAAAIMVVLFLAFVLGPDLTIKLFGLGLAVAVFLDALIVRSVLVPALMLALGRHNWYVPAWLDKALPQVNVEGHEPEREPVGASSS